MKIFSWSVWGMLIAAISIFAFFAFTGEYFFSLNSQEQMSPAAIRPLIVITLILAMLGFGGTLLLRPLFAPSDDQKLEERFKLSREIFLSFSGVFATVIGFYFGSLDRPTSIPADTAGEARFRLSPSVDGDGTIHFELMAAGKPYTAILLQRKSAPVQFEPENPDKTKFKLAYSPNVKECPSDLEVVIRDANDRPSAIPLKLDAQTLASKKWVVCNAAPTPASSTPSSPSPAQS